MQFSIYCLSFWICVTLSSAFSKYTAHSLRPNVTLQQRSIVSGVIDGKYSSVRQFLGIPYAQPPVGELRWEAPRANQLPRSVDATAYGTSCTQFLGAIANVFTEDVLEFNIGNINTTGEDCLTLSIWTPQQAQDLPVIVFFYGGGWYTGGQDIQYQIPTQWVQRTKDLIIVVPKYVCADGFCRTF
jgi:cholinesterase